MKHGQLTITLDAGAAIRITVEAALGQTYAGMFGDARVKLQQAPDDLAAAVRLVVFGCFWIEASCNKYLEQLLHRKVGDPLSKALWTAVDRRSVLEKVTLISALVNDGEGAEFQAVLTAVKTVFSLRNRLAHFRDESFLIAEHLTLDELVAVVSEPAQIREADLIVRLRQPNIEKVAEHVQAVHDWLVSAYGQAAPGGVEHELEGGDQQ